MAETVEFELVSPQKLLKSQPVDMVVVPCAEGDIGVLPGHTPLIATVRPGVVDIHDDGKVAERIFVAGGFVEVTAVRCTLLAEEAIAIADINRADVEERLKAANKAREDAADAAEKASAETGIETLEAMLEAMESVVHTH
ncbi:ATP synthase F1 subunit epsilon [Varunaivibrio sulfuroxidans]|uniref:ATP synthase epsilon chain n=1 Tax=Varunaivibrio sulfuroxidans TaxID=1773489 RepID=A0A4R3JC93_9PROT|nr:ATP synthase F1 subunit epsilon [Varunaivibrio sulfuroxidans]TCS63588.1 ATP synthase F1 subcomplex epsilon subunit [Varunaivibrio sulfuroxidans]WES30269.1 ATP synthase F1 subunit epsilon [Varunaivibrio sulfuroxidans]